jgi:hypothetical protein
LLDVQYGTAGTSGYLYGQHELATFAPTATSSASNVGFFGNAATQPGNTQNFTGHISALTFEVDHYGTGTLAAGYGIGGEVVNRAAGKITNAYGIYAFLRTTSTGKITNGYGTYIDAPEITVAGTLSNYTGLYIANPTAVTGAYGLYSAGGKNYFGGNVGIGTTTPGANLEVNGTTKFDGLATFMSGQTFPGTGTVTSVGSGAGLAGGPITTTGTLSIASGGVTNTMLANPSLTVTAGTGLSGGGAVALGNSVTLTNTGILSLGVSAPIATTGGQTPTLSITSAGVTDALLANSYSGTGACAAGKFVTTLARNAAPTCTAGNLGTVTSVGSGAGLTGGPITSTGSLSIATAGVTDAMLANSYSGTGACAAGQVVTTLARNAAPTCVTASTGTVTSVATGLGLTGGPITASGTLAIDTTVVPQLGVTNVFTTSQWANGYLYAYPTGDLWAFYGLNTSTDSTHPTLYLENDDSTSAGDLVFNAVGPNYGGQCTIDVSGNLFCTGTLGLAIKKTSDNRQVGLYTVQSSENWIEDFGSGALVNGVATIDIEPQFAQTVTTDASYHVFLTPNGDCEGLYVTQKGAASFEVHELKGGKSNVQFDYRIVAHRKGFEAARLPDLTEKFQKKAQPPARVKAALASRH